MVYSITRFTYKNLFEALLLIPFAHRKYCRIGFQYRIRSRIDVLGLLVLHHDNDGHARVLTNVQAPRSICQQKRIVVQFCTIQ